METGKRLSSISERGKGISPKRKRMSKSTDPQKRKLRDGSLKESLQSKGKYSKPSMIPVPKVERTEPKGVPENQRKSSSSSKLCCPSTKLGRRAEDFESKLTLLEEKEKSIARYHLKVEDLIRKLTEIDHKENGKSLQFKTLQNPPVRKMTSESLMFIRNKPNDDILTDLENNINQISKIWLKTTTDLSRTLKNLKRNPSLEPVEFELEKVRIQLAIKQTKSLTLLKTRDIIAEAKKLFRNRKTIRMELEHLVNYDNLKLECGKCGCFKEDSTCHLVEKYTSTSFESEDKREVGGTGDSPKESDLESQEVSTTSNDGSEREKLETTMAEEDSLTKGALRPVMEDSSSEEKEKNSDEESKKQNKPRADTETLAREMTKKNETITHLNNKIFELQKICNEQTYKCNQLQVVLSQFSEKIQWSQVLWKQISKLKEQIKGLQHSNKQLESQKRGLECKITKLDQQLDRLIKLNHFLNQKKYLFSAQEPQECRGGECRLVEESRKTKHEKCNKESESNTAVGERVLAEKQNAINQLKSMLVVMKDQENFAQKQISVFQNKIEEFEKNLKA